MIKSLSINQMGSWLDNNTKYMRIVTQNSKSPECDTF
jgi:hypothetical protein